MVNFLIGWWFILVLIVLIFVVLKFKHIKHKFFLIFMILVILFLYVSLSNVLSNTEANLTSFSGIAKAGKVYYGWLVHAFGNVKSLTGNVLKMNWSVNNSTGILT